MNKPWFPDCFVDYCLHSISNVTCSAIVYVPEQVFVHVPPKIVARDSRGPSQSAVHLPEQSESSLHILPMIEQADYIFGLSMLYNILNIRCSIFRKLTLARSARNTFFITTFLTFPVIVTTCKKYVSIFFYVQFLENII